MMRKNFSILLIFAGILFCFLGFVIIFLSSITSVAVPAGNISTGGIIFIGPFPIVFGTGEYGLQLIWLSIIILILMLIVSYIFLKGYSRDKTSTF
ncbi:MAG: DUF131 domain-containing protein [Nitrososphaeria archaeon]|nr:DUF131 domain-containing protein [Nitrososphaeria archaeon]